MALCQCLRNPKACHNLTPMIYLKMKVLGAIDVAPRKLRHERVHNVAAMVFLDEEGNQYRFTWRTI